MGGARGIAGRSAPGATTAVIGHPPAAPWPSGRKSARRAGLGVTRQLHRQGRVGLVDLVDEPEFAALADLIEKANGDEPAVQNAQELAGMHLARLRAWLLWRWASLDKEV